MKSEHRTEPASKAPEGPDRPIGELLGELYRDFSTMVDRQIALARHEAATAAQSAGRGIAILAAGGVVGLVGLIYLMLAVVYALGRVMPEWAAALLVGAVLAIGGGVAVASGLERLRALTRPLSETRETLREDREWARERARELGREVRGG